MSVASLVACMNSLRDRVAPTENADVSELWLADEGKYQGDVGV